jgi:hypothetical protein
MRRFALSLVLVVSACEAGDPSLNEYDDEAVDGKADSLSSTSTYYQARHDVRRCVSPLCGGMWVKRVGRALTKCVDGKYADECYVPEADLSKTGLTGDDASTFANRLSSGHAIVRGSIAKKSYAGFGTMGVLKATEAWDAPSDALPSGDTFAVSDNGKRCFAYPCNDLHAATLNRTVDKEFSDLDYDATGASDEDILASYDLLATRFLAAGTFKKVKNAGPGGTATVLVVSQFYLPAKSKPVKTCVKTGCSAQLCSDHQVITTCEFRPEYECFQAAECKVQADGNCGYTQTADFAACLAKF